MGRPIHGINQKPTLQTVANPILTISANINGTLATCVITKQNNKNTFTVQSLTNPALRGIVMLTNGSNSNHGTGYIAWSTTKATGFVASLAAKIFTDFKGNSYAWTLVSSLMTAGTAYISNNTND